TRSTRDWSSDVCSSDLRRTCRLSRAVSATVVLVGPTAVGKTAAGIALVERIGGEIVSADSRCVYRYMDVGTAKPTAAERARVSRSEERRGGEARGAPGQ